MAQIGTLISIQKITLKVWNHSGYTFSADANFSLYYDPVKNRVGIYPRLYGDNETNLYPGIPSELIGDSKLYIEDKVLTLPITGDLENDRLYLWAWYSAPGIEAFYEYDDTTGEGGFAYKDRIDFTWEFEGFTYNGYIDFPAAFQDLVDGLFYQHGLDFYDFNTYDIKPTIYLDPSPYREIEQIIKFEIALSSDGINADIMDYFDFTTHVYTQGSKSFDLTSDAINQLENLPASSNFVDVYYLVRFTTYKNYTSQNSYVATCEIIESPLELNPVVVDSNTATIALTGNSGKLIRYASRAKYTANAVPGSAATIKELYLTHAGVRYEGQEGFIDNVENGTFNFYLEDSRGSSLSKKITLPIVEYIKLTCNKEYLTPPDAETGDIQFKVKGNCFKGSFGAAENSLTIQYRFKESSADNFTAWTNVSNITRPDFPVNTWYASGTIPGLDYRNTYQVQFRAVDSIGTATTSILRATTIPVFDWSKEDFNINVPTTINGVEYGKNVILWHSSNGSQMTSTHTAYLNQPLQDQAHGIVLVFSAADGDVSWSTHFVPKEIITYNQGGGQMFLMANNAGFSTFGGKYLYIYDDMIKGHTSNNSSIASGAGSNIAYDNSAFVLRYVIGV